MTDQWKHALAELEGYVAANPEIKISRQVTIMPDDKRAGFYQLFDRARLAFLEEKTPAIYSEACQLSSAFLAEAGELKNTLRLANITTPPQLQWLLTDPPKGLSRGIFDPLFRLLQGERSLGEFETEAISAVEAYWKNLYKQGYWGWVILSLANMLLPDKVLAPSWKTIVRECHELQPDEKRGWAEQHVPEPDEIDQIELGHEGASPAFIVPDIILSSQKLGKFVSFGANLDDASWHAKNASNFRDWIILRKRGLESKPRLNWPGLVVYTDNEPAEISIIADFSRFLRPEIMLEYMDRADWYQQGDLEKIKTRNEFFRPSLGTFIITRHPVPDEVIKALDPENIPVVETAGASPDSHIFIIPAAGYDRSVLAPIIDALLKQVEAGGKTELTSQPGID
jgi:hypothetical protein